MVSHIILADILLIARKILRNSQNIRAYYMRNHLIRCNYSHDVINRHTYVRLSAPSCKSNVKRRTVTSSQAQS